jgi:hypothetical protein
MARVSILKRVAVAWVREWQMPAVVAPKGFQAHQGFGPFRGPRLAWPSGPVLVLPPGKGWMISSAERERPKSATGRKF